MQIRLAWMTVRKVQALEPCSAGEPADPTPTEEQSELQEGDNSVEFKTQGANMSPCDTEKQDVQSTEC